MSSLSILIPSLSKRDALLQRLLSRINSQTKSDYDLEILLSVDNGQKKIGAKRNEFAADRPRRGGKRGESV